MEVAISIGATKDYLEARGLDVVDPRNVTQHAAQAKVVAIGLTGKTRPGKHDTAKAKDALVFLHAQAHGTVEEAPEPHSDDADASRETEGGIDDPRTESDAAQAELAEGADEDDADPATSPTDDEASDEDGGEDDEPKASSSVVKAKYRQEYKARGDARGCGDWLHRVIAACTLGPTKRLDYAAWKQLCDVNAIDVSKYETDEKQAKSGWQGRCRMSGGLAMRPKAAAEMSFVIPLALYEANEAKFEALGLGRGNEEDVEVVDDVVYLRPDTAWANGVIAKQAKPKEPSNGKRKPAKS